MRVYTVLLVAVLQLVSETVSDLIPRQAGKMDVRPAANQNTWLMDYIGLEYSAPCSHPIDTRPEVPENRNRPEVLRGSFYLQRSHLVRGAQILWVHDNPELKITCTTSNNRALANGWEACNRYTNAPSEDGDLSADLKSRLKSRLRDFKRSADGKHFERVTFEVVNASPPGRYFL